VNFGRVSVDAENANTSALLLALMRTHLVQNDRSNTRIALPRCDTAFFISSGISAPLMPVSASRKCGS
jgi:hypothetical protein